MDIVGSNYGYDKDISHLANYGYDKDVSHLANIPLQRSMCFGLVFLMLSLEFAILSLAFS